MVSLFQTKKKANELKLVIQSKNKPKKKTQKNTHNFPIFGELRPQNRIENVCCVLALFLLAVFLQKKKNKNMTTKTEGTHKKNKNKTPQIKGK